MSNLGTPDRPLRVAIVGSGPSGFYAAEGLFKTFFNSEVDMYERLPTPYGLVRGGVAPDHFKIKGVMKIYEKIAADPRFFFWGNIEIGRDLSVSDLGQFYDAIIFACGAEADQRLNIPGEDLPGSHTATEFVGWYNGHPDFKNRVFNLSPRRAVIIGQGNVAVDVARILAKTVNELKNTDIAEHALKNLEKSLVDEIYLIGRRGPVQAAFTRQEIKELGELEDCDPIINPDELRLNPESQAELLDPDNERKKNYSILEEFSKRLKSSKRKKLYVQFKRSPVGIEGAGRVERVIFEKNELTGEAGKQKARGTGKKETLPCGLFFRSVGYRGVSLPGVPFDSQKGIFPNIQGRIVSEGKPILGLYAAGWIKRGPSGVIGTNKPDSYETVDCLLKDIQDLKPCSLPQRSAVQNFLRTRGLKWVTFSDWNRIDLAEIERGKIRNKLREKFTSVDEMLKVIGKN